MSTPLVQLLYFDGCPNWHATRELVEEACSELAIDADLELILVADEETAHRVRFLGSPTIRVDGRDIDPTAGDRDRYTLSCRIYRTEHGTSGQPDRRWLSDALREAELNRCEHRPQRLSRP